MSLEDAAKSLNHCTEQLGRSTDASNALDEGFLIFHNLSADLKLCERVAERLIGFGDVLLKAKDAYKNAVLTLNDCSTMYLERIGDLKHAVEEGRAAPLLSELRKFEESLHKIDGKINEAEYSIDRLKSYSMMLQMECAKQSRSKTTAGGVFLASGCLTLTLAAATFLIKLGVNASGGSLSPAASLVFRFSPWNTALAGGIVTILGVSDARHSNHYSKLTLDFGDLSDDLTKELSSSRSFRTKIQRLIHAIDTVTVSLEIAMSTRELRVEEWNLFWQWVSLLDVSLRNLMTKIITN